MIQKPQIMHILTFSSIMQFHLYKKGRTEPNALKMWSMAQGRGWDSGTCPQLLITNLLEYLPPPPLCIVCTLQISMLHYKSAQMDWHFYFQVLLYTCLLLIFARENISMSVSMSFVSSGRIIFSFIFSCNFCLCSRTFLFCLFSTKM